MKHSTVKNNQQMFHDSQCVLAVTPGTIFPTVLPLLNCLCRFAGTDGGQDFVEAATTLFKDVAVAVEENEGFLRAAFGAEALLTVITELHGQVLLPSGKSDTQFCCSLSIRCQV